MNAASDELRTLRDLRLAIREIEAELGRVHMSPATVLSRTFGRGYIHRARTALRQAERHFAASDPDPMLLKPLSPSLGRRPATQPRRRRYRCNVCFLERLLSEDDYTTHRYAGAVCSGTFELVPRMKPRKASC